MFRLSDADQAPVLVIKLDDQEAALPLARIGREFGVVAGSGDAKMLELIVTSLEYVSCLRLGDELPAEVVSGQASWTPRGEFKRLAEARLRGQLIAWLTEGYDAEEADQSTLVAMADDPALRAQAQEAMGRAAAELGLTSVEDVLARVEDLAGELAYVEHLRACFLVRLEALPDKIMAVLPRWRADSGTSEAVTQVRKLLMVASRKSSSRFEDIDVQTGEIISSLRNLDLQRQFIRAGRDWLYRSFRGFEPLLDRFDRLDGKHEREARQALDALYQFLARRYMPMTEWLRQERAPYAPAVRAMGW
jgi:hypothetical protein